MPDGVMVPSLPVSGSPCSFPLSAYGCRSASRQTDATDRGKGSRLVKQEPSQH